MATPKVGGEVDAYCTKCRMTLAHTILAMLGAKIARVRCNTCGGDHAYRAEPGTVRAGGAKPRAATPRAEKVVITWEQRLAGKDPATAKTYSAKETFAVGDLVNHPTFGLGLVEAVRDDKADITFKAEAKTLVHGKGGGLAKPAFSPPKGKAHAPADKPTTDEELAAAVEPEAEAEPMSEEASREGAEDSSPQ
jgi:hypothetical protein